MRTISILVLALGGVALSASGQGASRLPQASSDQKKQLQQAADRLRQAQENGELDKAKDTAKGLMGNLPGGLSDAAKKALESPEAKAKAAEAAKAAAKSLLPEAQKMMGGLAPQTEGAEPAPAPADQPPATAPAAEGPKPQALQPLSAPPEGTDNRKPVAVIEADTSVFDPNTGILIYTGNVRARHPQFYIECEELEVHLDTKETKTQTAGTKEEKPAAPKGLDPIQPNGKGKDSQNSRQSSVKKAIATGPMVRIEKANDQGDLQRAFCRHAVYEGKSGVITMRDNPQVQTGNVMQVATTPDTVMTFDEKGNFHSNRRTRTVILSEDNAPGAQRSNP